MHISQPAITCAGLVSEPSRSMAGPAGRDSLPIRAICKEIRAKAFGRGSEDSEEGGKKEVGRVEKKQCKCLERVCA